MKNILILVLLVIIAGLVYAQQTAAVLATLTWKDQTTQDRIVLAVSQAYASDYLKFRRLDDTDPANDRADSRAVRTAFAERVAAKHLIEVARGVELNSAGDSARAAKQTEQSTALVEPPQ